MGLKALYRPVAISCLAVSLAACSTTSGSGSNGSMTASQAQTQGAGEQSAFKGSQWGKDGQPIVRGHEISNTVYFGFNQYDLTDQAKAALKENAAFLMENPAMSVLVEGFTDPRGSAQYNLALGQRRADAVRNELLVQGVPASQIKTLSYGEQCLAMPGMTTEAAYKKDRRAIIDYQPNSGQGCPVTG